MLSDHPKPAPATFPIHALAQARWSPRAFSDRPVDEATLRSLLEAARWAPSAFNAQPWAFVVATRRDAAAHGRLAAALNEGNRTWAAAAPVLLAALAQPESRPGRPNPHAWYDVGQAVAWLSVEATARGLALHQMAGFDRAALAEAAAVPAGWEPVVVIALGYPAAADQLPAPLAEREAAPRRRKPQEDFVSFGRFGEAQP